MSKARGKNIKAETGSTVEDVLVTGEFQGTDPDTLAFAEWSDQEINLEKWDTTPAIKDKASLLQQKILFEDPQQVHLPPSVSADTWKRCSELFANVNFTIFINKSTYPDIVKPNIHLLHSTFYRNFITSIEILLYLGSTTQFAEEYGSSGYTASVNRPWRPWLHIYSNCKIIKGHSEHTPLYNPAGKYVVRLFWMGSWRKIYVDNMIPVDKTGNILLPSVIAPKESNEPEVVKTPKTTKSKGGSTARKETIEIWPFILCKALLKIASLSWSTSNELNDFDIIQCLTGWVPQKIKINDISPNDIWEILEAYVKHFVWDGDKKEGSPKKNKKQKNPKEKDSGGKKKKIVIPSGIEDMRDGDYYVVAVCRNFELSILKETEEYQTITHDLLIGQIRNIPIIKPPPRPELEFWKTFRYEQWATEQGILPPDVKKLNIKSLSVVSPFQRLMHNWNSTDNPKETTHEMDNIDKKSEKSSKSSKKSVKSKATKHLLEPDPSFWINFSELQDTFTNINIYFQPRLFKSKTKISDINFVHKTDGFKQIINPIEMQHSRNEPVYVFSDSIDSKFIVINYSQIGNISVLEKHVDEASRSSEYGEMEDLDICVNILLQKTEEDLSVTYSESKMANKSLVICPFNTKPISFLLETYTWTSNSFGEATANIQTFGSKSLILELKPGRVSFRLWIASQCSYVLQIFSDTPMTIGCLEEFYSACSVESQLLTNKCFELSSSFGKLVQTFGTPDYPNSLLCFYRAYKPNILLNKKDLALMHKTFLKSFFATVSNSSNILNRLECTKLLLLQLKTFSYINPYLDETPHLCASDFETDNQIMYAKLMERAAVKIQAFFKGLYIRLQIKKMNERHKQYMSIFETLKKTYFDMFSSENRLTYCPKLFRMFFENDDMNHIKENFELYKDIKLVFQTFQFSNSISTSESCWLLLCRYDFHINSLHEVFVKINVFCNLSAYFVRVFDNDTEKEIRKYTNNVAVHKYSSNVSGYTVLCYGWTENTIKIHWKLIIATQKMSSSNIVIVPGIPATSFSLRNHYVPSFDGTICRFIIKVGSDSFLTAHLTTSYDRVRISFQLFDSSGKILHKSIGVGSAVLPLMHLKCAKPTEPKKLLEIALQRTNKKKESIDSNLSQITYTKLNKKYGSCDSLGSKISITGKRKRSKGNGDSEQDILKRFGNRDESIKSNGTSERLSRKSSSKTKSIEKISQRSLTRSRNRQSESLFKLIEDIETEYILEAKVMGDSWPLTATEWAQVQQIRKAQYLYLANNNNSKYKLIPKRSSQTAWTFERPFWVLDLVHGTEETLEFLEDTSKSEMRREEKLKWFGEDKERYGRGMELRKQFLEEFTTFREPPVEDINIRSNFPEDFSNKIIKELSITDLFINPQENIDDDICKVKQTSDYIAEEQAIEETMKEYRKEEKIATDELQHFINKQIGDLNTMSTWFNDIRADSEIMIHEALTLQQEYLKRLEQEGVKSRSSKRDKGEKKKKKK